MGAAGGLLVADLTRMESFGILSKLKKEVLTISPEAKFVTIANKCDLISDLSHLEEKIQSQLDPNQPYFISSAKTGENVETGFLSLTQLFLET